MLNNRQTNRRRGRGRGPQNNGGRQDNGSRIDNRARGNAPQLLEKYKNLAREAQLQGDRVLTEYYLQFSDHYFRILAENRARFEENRPQRRDEWQNDDGYDGDGGDDGQMSSADGGDDDQQPRQQRQTRDRRPERPRRDDEHGEGNQMSSPDAGDDDQQPRQQRQTRDRRPERPRRDSQPMNTGTVRSGADDGAIDAAILPPALGVSSDPIQDLDAEPAPVRRRGRPRRAEAGDTETAAAE